MARVGRTLPYDTGPHASAYLQGLTNSRCLVVYVELLSWFHQFFATSPLLSGSFSTPSAWVIAAHEAMWLSLTTSCSASIWNDGFSFSSSSLSLSVPQMQPSYKSLLRTHLLRNLHCWLLYFVPLFLLVVNVQHHAAPTSVTCSLVLIPGT